MEEWITKNGKLVCSSCGIPIEQGMPFKGEKLTPYMGWYVKDEMHDIRNGYDRCYCKKNSTYYGQALKENMLEAQNMYEADKWKRMFTKILIISVALAIFFLVDLG